MPCVGRLFGPRLDHAQAYRLPAGQHHRSLRMDSMAVVSAGVAEKTEHASNSGTNNAGDRRFVMGEGMFCKGTVN